MFINEPITPLEMHILELKFLLKTSSMESHEYRTPSSLLCQPNRVGLSFERHLKCKAARSQGKMIVVVSLVII